MQKFSVKQLARLADVSVRTLHHYDQIGLLKPSISSEANYRYYQQEDLLRLQQILFYKELDIPLAQIAGILDDEDFDMLAALHNHKKELQKRKSRLEQLITTVNNTIVQLKNKNKKMNYDEMYKGFSKEQATAYEKEARERWGDEKVDESNSRITDMDKNQWGALNAEMEAINTELVPLMHLTADDPQVQMIVKRHFHLMGKFYTVTPEIYEGLANMYVEDHRFTGYYEKHAEGLAAFLSQAMLLYCKSL